MSQVGLGIYTALQVCVCLDTPESGLQGCLWSSLLQLLHELRVSNPILFLPFSLHTSGLLQPDPPQKNQQQQQQQDETQQQKEQQQDETQQKQQEQHQEKQRQQDLPRVCCLLGCLGSSCDVRLPAAATATAEQNHRVAISCFVAQASSMLLHCHMQQQLQRQPLLAAADPSLYQLSDVRSFLFGVGTPPCWLLLQRQLAATLSSSSNAAADMDPGAAAGAAAYFACSAAAAASQACSAIPRPSPPAAAAAAAEETQSRGGVVVCVPPCSSNSYLSFCRSGSRQQKLWRFKRKYLDSANLTASWTEVASDAISALLELPEAVWFAPDPETTAAGYSRVIAEPMWLRKIQARLRANFYSLPYNFKQDVALIFKNARQFNAPQDRAYRDCCILEHKFNALWSAINTAFQRAARNKRHQQQLQQQQQKSQQQQQDAPPMAASPGFDTFAMLQQQQQQQPPLQQPPAPQQPQQQS